METDHIVKSFDEELNKLTNMVVEMGGLAEAQLADAIDALIHWDLAAANLVVENDKRIDALEMAIDRFTIKILTLRQPLADDLRKIIAALKIASNLERIGDYSKNIAKRTAALTQTPQMGVAATTVSRMGDIVQIMIKNVLDAYINNDVEKADDVRARDQEVDHLHTSLFRELLTYMMEDPRNITTCTHLLFIAKNVERVGDHVTSIAEQVHFIIHGAVPNEERLKGDESSITIVEHDSVAGENA